jgi:hypothetical protein
MDDSFRCSILFPGFSRPNPRQRRDGEGSASVDLAGGGSAWDEAFWNVACDIAPRFTRPLDETC